MCTALPRNARRPGKAFTLLELLIVVAIITLLMAILIPSLGKGRNRARITVNLSNLRGIGVGVALYQAENNGWFLIHEGNFNAPGWFSDDVKDNSGVFPEAQSLVDAGLVPDLPTANKSRRAHWVDYVFDYASNARFYVSPMLSTQELGNFTLDFVKPGMYKHSKWGGYGYNYQFLGREWTAGIGAYRNRINNIANPATMIVVGDSAGSRKGADPPGSIESNSYVIDPPLYSINAGAKFGKYYQAPNAAASDADLAANPLGSANWRYRCFPQPRNDGSAAFLFADGHAELKLLKEIDDSNGDGMYDDGYWSGTADANPAAR